MEDESLSMHARKLGVRVVTYETDQCVIILTMSAMSHAVVVCAQQMNLRGEDRAVLVVQPWLPSEAGFVAAKQGSQVTSQQTYAEGKSKRYAKLRL